MESAQFGTFNVQSMEKQHTEKWHSIKCAENGSFKMWNVQSLECANYEMCKLQNERIMDCTKDGMCRIQTVQNMKCEEYGMFRIWNVQNIEVANVHKINRAQFHICKK